MRTLRSIYHEAGVSGLYAGLPVTMLIAVPANVLYFATYESLRDALQPRIPNAGEMRCVKWRCLNQSQNKSCFLKVYREEYLNRLTSLDIFSNSQNNG